MKIKNYTLCLLTLGISSVSVAQSGNKIAQRGGVIPAVTHHDNPTRGAVIFSEDFASGIPGTWDNTTVSGPVDWKYTTVGHTGDYPTQSLLSSTSSNGWILVDSDADNFSGGGAEDARLTTPFIDCSSYSNVKIEFQQMFRRWQQDITTVRVSVDSGYTWVDYEINQGVTQSGTDNPDYVNIDISADIASNPDSVLIQFWWQGAWDYGWQIDDFAVKELDPNDILIKKTSLSEDVTYYKVPESQVQPLSFSAFAENVGYNDQTLVQLYVDVDDGSGSVFINSSSALPLLSPGTSDSLSVGAVFTPTAVGLYDVTLNVDQSETDDVTANNEALLNFEVTDTVYAIDNGVYGGQWWDLDDGSGSSNAFEIGAVYEVVTDEWASSSSVFIGDNSDAGVAFELNIYEYNAGTQTYDLITTTDTYAVTSGDLGNWVTMRFVNDVELTAGTDYLVTLVHYGGPEALYVGYGTNSSFRGSTLTYDYDQGAWSNQPRTPMIRLNLGEVGLSVDENEVELSVYPNPTTGIVNIDIPSSELESVKLFDLSGKLVKQTKLSRLDISNLSEGTYFLEIISSKGITNKTITKE
ncbi:T9SS type A sorting domain-containing protein [Parvicella tangerina]|uniref:Secretion system C-terminal sorting domain-containing protein n=1 Tax=Parvicella tangerina TaxID=2829795 RepID=A0A916ND11_9FLAO|nr:T9SS type A sorting domain-containing protein [Parvicella tangerina]CAG5084255.1 hypothetical protein CRYO30217_02418 [Parvicella tangerina]